MYHSISSKKKAIQLRKTGQSYNEISQILGVPKSTLSSWLRSMPLSETIKRKNIEKAKVKWAKNITEYNRIRASNYKKEYNQIINRYAKEVQLVGKKELFWIGLALFWAEGGKREKSSVRFANAEISIIKTMMRFFREVCHISDSKFHFRIHLHPNIEDDRAKKFWANNLKVPISQFYRSQTMISKASKFKRNFHQLPMGTLHIYINNAEFSKKMKGWVKGLDLRINMPR